MSKLRRVLRPVLVNGLYDPEIILAVAVFDLGRL